MRPRIHQWFPKLMDRQLILISIVIAVSSMVFNYGGVIVSWEDAILWFFISLIIGYISLTILSVAYDQLG